MDPTQFTYPCEWTLNRFDYRRTWYGPARRLGSGHRPLIHYRGYPLSFDLFGGMAIGTLALFTATPVNYLLRLSYIEPFQLRRSGNWSK